MGRKKEVDIEIDRLTNSIVNSITAEVFETEFNKVLKKEIKKKDWVFDWGMELKDTKNEVYKMTTIENKGIIQGLISLKIDIDFVFVNLVENANFNRGKERMYEGVGGNLFAFACKRSLELGFGGFVAFEAKTALIGYYETALGAERALKQRMFINNFSAEKLIHQYFKNK